MINVIKKNNTYMSLTPITIVASCCINSDILVFTFLYDFSNLPKYKEAEVITFKLIAGIAPSRAHVS